MWMLQIEWGSSERRAGGVLLTAESYLSPLTLSLEREMVLTSNKYEEAQ